MSKKSEFVVGFDLGGSKMISAVLDGKLNIVTRKKKKTNAHEGGKVVYQRIKDTILASLEEAAISSSALMGIGIAAPGPLDKESGAILDTPNLDFNNFPIRDRLQSDFNIPVMLENDVNAGVYGEYKRGAAQGYRSVVGLFPGTGLGGGIILDGRLYGGSTGNAGEIGHMIIQINGPLCGCGHYGCVEALASRTALTKDIIALASTGDAPVVLSEAGTDFSLYKSGVLAKAVKKEDKKVIRAIKRSAEFLGVAMANCVNILNPDAVVLGGGLVEKLGKIYLQSAEESMRKHALPELVEGVKVVQAELGDDAVLLGAAILVTEMLSEN